MYERECNDGSKDHGMQCHSDQFHESRGQGSYPTASSETLVTICAAIAVLL